MANLPQERLSIAASGLAAARAALDWTIEYVRRSQRLRRADRVLPEHRVFTLAELATEITIGESFIDACTRAHNDGELTAEDAAMAKWWCTELQGRTTTRCLQLYGGNGYMSDYPIAKAFIDARVTTIYGGTTEIMKEIIGRSLRLA